VSGRQLQKKISVITATLNAGHCISGLIACLQEQSNKNFEWVVADGGSKDDTLALLCEASDLDLVLDSRPDHGIYDAMNRALDLASGDYYLVVGADDLLYHDAVEHMHQVLNSFDSPDLALFGVKFGAHQRAARWHPNRGWLGASHLVTAHSVGMLIRKSLHDIVGRYSRSFPICADGLFIKQVAAVPGVKVTLSDHVVGEFSLEGVSNSNTARGLCEGYLIQLSTERSLVLQTLIFVLRLLKNLRRICREKRC
jgi:glycosyltransferase involved in cell wall biosynthesis